MPRQTKFSGHIVFRSVRQSVSQSVSPSVPFTSKFSIKVVFREVNVLFKRNFTYSILIIWMLQISCHIRYLSHCSSVRSSVCLSVPLTSKFSIKVVFREVNVLFKRNFTYSILIIWMLQISCHIRYLSHCSSVRSSVCLSVPLTSKFSIKVVFREVNVLFKRNFTYSILIIWMLQISCHIRYLSHCSSVRSSVCLSVPLMSKFSIKVVFREVNVLFKRNFTYSILIIWMLQISCHILYLSHRSSVRSSVCLSIPLTSKFGIKL